MFGLPSPLVIGAAILLAVGVVIGAYWKGERAGEAACQLRVERAIAAEQARQGKAIDDALEQASVQDQSRQQEIDELQKQVDDYEASLGKDDRCALTPADVERLSKLR